MQKYPQQREPTYLEKTIIYINTNRSYWSTMVGRYLMDALKAVIAFVNQLFKDALNK